MYGTSTAMLQFASDSARTYSYLMKYVLSIIFIGIYLSLSAGVNVLIHTCGGERTVDVMPTSTSDPCGCAEEMSDDMCCTLVLKVFRLDDEQQAAKTATVTSLDYCVLDYPSTIEVPLSEVVAAPVPVDASPPPPVPPTILNCTFLI
jgi:hypothetical protein